MQPCLYVCLSDKKNWTESETTHEGKKEKEKQRNRTLVPVYEATQRNLRAT